MGTPWRHVRDGSKDASQTTSPYCAIVHYPEVLNPFFLTLPSALVSDKDAIRSSAFVGACCEMSPSSGGCNLSHVRIR